MQCIRAMECEYALCSTKCEYALCSLFILQCDNAVYSCSGVWIRLMFIVYIAVRQCSVFVQWRVNMPCVQWSVDMPYVQCLYYSTTLQCIRSMECEYALCSLFILQCNYAVYSCNGMWICLVFTICPWRSPCHHWHQGTLLFLIQSTFFRDQQMLVKVNNHFGHNKVGYIMAIKTKD